MRKFENVYLDLSGFGLFRRGALEYIVGQVGAERILFGSNYPVSNPAVYIAGVDYENLTDTNKELIFYKNAERLLGVSV